MNGALNTSLIVALFTLMALRPPMPRRSTPFNLQFALGYLINEQPFLGLGWLLAGTTAILIRPEPTSLMWWLVAGLSAMDALALGLIALRARSARPALSQTFRTAFGAGLLPYWTRTPWFRIVLLPLFSWRPDVRRIRNRRYGPARRGHRLDVYVSRRHHRSDAPVLMYVHGGGFRIGSKALGAHPLLYRLAAEGWVCVGVNYRLFRARYRDQLTDVRTALEWTRVHADSYGGSPNKVFVAGGSSGAHLAATAALSGSEVRGVIALGGYYGETGQPGPESTSPHAYITADAPPFLIVHGSLDTLVLANDARKFADHLRAVSQQSVAYAELPGTHHNFDLFHSMRFHAVADAIVRFAELTGSAGSSVRAQRRKSS